MDEVVRPGENVDDKIRKNFFIKVDVSKTECYLGEPIVATYKLICPPAFGFTCYPSSFPEWIQCL